MITYIVKEVQQKRIFTFTQAFFNHPSKKGLARICCACLQEFGAPCSISVGGAL